MPSKPVARLAQTTTSLRTQRRYWLNVFPRVYREQRRWAGHAAAVPDPTLRRAAVAAQDQKRGNPQGAAIFATLAPARHRGHLVRALVAFQTIYDYLDTVSEHPAAASPANARQLHQALVAAVDPAAEAFDPYTLNTARNDGGYLELLVSACRRASESLPSYPLVVDRVGYFAELLARYQQAIGVARPEDEIAAGWARHYEAVYPELRWWEIAAAVGSSLPVFALLAAAADPGTRPCDAAEIERAYFPEIAVLHSLLDGLIDQAEDAIGGHHNLVSHYVSRHEAAERLSELARRAAARAGDLPHGGTHLAILAAMTSYYLAAPEASHAHALQARQGILAALDGITAPTMLLFRVKRLAAAVVRAADVRGAPPTLQR